MINSVRKQIRIIIEKRWAVCVLIFMFLLVFINFFSNVFQYEGTDIQVMINAMRLLFLSGDAMDAGTLSFYFLQLFPLLVILPVGFSYADDKNTKEEIYIVSRIGRNKYYFGKTMAAFIVNFVVFSVPFLFEIFLNCIAFPLNANGNMYNIGVYDKSYILGAENYMFFGIFKVSPIVYAIVTNLMFGVIAGVLGVFTVAFSMFFCKFKVALLFPVYILLYGIGMINNLFPDVSVKTSHFAYLSMFDITYKSEFSYLLLFATITAVSLFCIFVKSRKDVL